MTTSQTNVVELLAHYDWNCRSSRISGVLFVEATHWANPDIRLSGTIGKRGAIRMTETRTYSDSRLPESTAITTFLSLADSACRWSKQ
jgi:hypothetical protein